jgi:hypothetical protein
MYVPRKKANADFGFEEKYLIWHIEGGLGKNIAATALCKDLKETYPDRQLILVVSYPEVFLNNPFIDRVYFVGNRPYFYDNYIKDKDVLIFRHEPYHQTGHITKTKHLIENWCDLLEIQYAGQTPKVYVNMVQKGTIGLWKRNRPTMVLQTNGGPLNGQKYGYSWCRDIPYELALQLFEIYSKDYHIFQITRPDSQKIPGAEIIDQPMSNMELFAVLIEAEKRILIDSCLQHAAAAFDLPSTVLWIGTSPTVFGYDIHTNIVSNPPKGDTKLIDSYLYDYSFDGMLHECPYIDYREMFDINELISII